MRTYAEIITEIKTTFISNPILQELYGISGANSFDDEFSLASLEAQLIEVVGTESKVVEDLMTMHTEEINRTISEMTPGTFGWYIKQAKAFQFGDSLVWNAAKLIYEYPVISDALQIVKLASIQEVGNILIVKVAKLVNGIPVPLEYSTEFTAFKIYFEQIKYAGVLISYISAPADLLNLNLRVYYDPMVFNSDGSLLLNSSSFPVKDKIDEYLRLTPFNGIFNITNLIDSLQEIDGVLNPIFESGETKTGSDSWQTVVDYYRPYSGYMKINTLTVNYLTI